MWASIPLERCASSWLKQRDLAHSDVVAIGGWPYRTRTVAKRPGANFV
jgi:hypothetical protein